MLLVAACLRSGQRFTAQELHACKAPCDKAVASTLWSFSIYAARPHLLARRDASHSALLIWLYFAATYSPLQGILLMHLHNERYQGDEPLLLVHLVWTLRLLLAARSGGSKRGGQVKCKSSSNLSRWEGTLWVIHRHRSWSGEIRQKYTRRR